MGMQIVVSFHVHTFSEQHMVFRAALIFALVDLKLLDRFLQMRCVQPLN